MRISLQGPNKYIQDRALLPQLGAYASTMGKRALLLLSRGGEQRFGKTIIESFDKSGCGMESCIFSGDINYREIERVVSEIERLDCDTVIGLGGGRVLDTARAAADIAEKKLIIVPTTASNDAPCSAVAVIHDENGKTVEVRSVSRNPDLVLMDTDIIAAAPAKYLSAGIGDALATYYEARANADREKSVNKGNYSKITALAMSGLCRDILFEYGEEAMKAAGSGEPSYAFEQVVHAASFLSGYGFENGGVAAAHAINEGFSVLSRCSEILHGDLVSFGILAQLELENSSEEEKECLREFMGKVGLSVCLSDLGLSDLGKDELMLVASAAAAAPPMKNMPFDVSAEDVFEAIIKADGQSV